MCPLRVAFVDRDHVRSPGVMADFLQLAVFSFGDVEDVVVEDAPTRPCASSIVTCRVFGSEGFVDQAD